MSLVASLRQTGAGCPPSSYAKKMWFTHRNFVQQSQLETMTLWVTIRRGFLHRHNRRIAVSREGTLAITFEDSFFYDPALAE